MNEAEARLILQSARPGATGADDAELAEALRLAAADPALGRWLEEEQAFDQAVAQHLAAIPAPFGLRTRILAEAAEPARGAKKWRWAFGFAAAIALLLLVVQGVSFWKDQEHGANLQADYAREMTSFIQLSPPLEMESGDLKDITNWIAKKEATPANIPAQLAALQPVGCRVLSFRGQKVTLICFEREGQRMAHLFVVDRAALPSLKPGDKPIFANEHGWMTATWAEGDRVYMITLQGGRAALEQFLPSA